MSAEMSDKKKRGALDGIRIIDLTSVVLGAYATSLLGDMGADIIKVESPSPKNGAGGDIMRWAGDTPSGERNGLGPIYMTINRNKRSVLLDLKQDSAREALLKLISTADVFAANIRYEGLKRLGLSYEDVRKVKPDIVYVIGTGYGEDGVYGGRPAYDDLIQAASGIASMASEVDGDPRPRFFPTLVADKTTGLFMANAILSALFHKERTGTGQFVEVPMMESMVSFLLTEHLYGHTYEPPTGPIGYVRVTAPDRKPYRTSDGYIAILPYSDKQWRDFFSLGGKPDLFETDIRFNTYENRTRNIRHLYAMVEDVTSLKSTEEWMTLLTNADIPCARVNRLGDLMQDPHLQSVGLFEKRTHPVEGSYWSIRHPVTYGETPASIRRDPPLLGENTQEVFRELGLNDDEIEKLLPTNT
ncbi:MAG: CoA transferase [Alphaproteobacteria bacterium]|nr:CoA transferase [Alphaproteobacteria bacterium]MBO6627033.1 CoA transferase [Alphaproteobacteria bacterium]